MDPRLQEKLQLYKKGQGMIARWTAGGLLLGMALYGCWSFQDYPTDEDSFLRTQLFGIEALNVSVDWAFLIAVVMAAALGALIYYFVVNHPKSAEFLIETEAELRKVSWPARHEYLNSSFVVILSVVVLSTWLVVCDTVIGFVLTKMGY